MIDFILVNPMLNTCLLYQIRFQLNEKELKSLKECTEMEISGYLSNQCKNQELFTAGKRPFLYIPICTVTALVKELMCKGCPMGRAGCPITTT